jgi:hypothetical protein
MTFFRPLGALGALALGGALAGACLPELQSVKERRESFDRDGLLGGVILDAPPPDMKPVGAVFGERVKLVGYTLSPPKPPPGGTVEVSFFWQALRPMAEDYQVFVHGDAVGEKQSRIHGDHYPAGGRYPTDVWQEGEIVRDTFEIFIPPGYGAKHLGLFTGLYKGSYRVPLTDAGVRPRTGDNRSRAVDIFF